MINTVLVTHDLKIEAGVPLDRLSEPDVKWYWVDFDQPNEEEAALLSTHFHFHHLAIEDCFHRLQRPKMDFYEGNTFFVLHSLKADTLEPEEVDVFLGGNYLVSLHLQPSPEIETVKARKLSQENTLTKGPVYLFYLIMDKIVDLYFPKIEEIEEQVDHFEVVKSGRDFIGDLNALRGLLLAMRHIVVPMRELVYRLLNSERMQIPTEIRPYFRDIDDHLHWLYEAVESNREVTADLRESYVSLNSNRMNTIMTTLTIVATIFIPLTFIVGVYGMNFDYMPELRWRWGYFSVWAVMLAVVVGMLFWFKKEDWYK